MLKDAISGGRPVPVCGRERGSVTMFVAAVVPALLLLFGLVYDLGGALRDRQQATGLAEESARAGAQALNSDGYRSGGGVSVAAATAETAAAGYLHAAGATGAVGLSGPVLLHVTVTTAHPTSVLRVLGIGTITVRGSATANLETGR